MDFLPYITQINGLPGDIISETYIRHILRINIFNDYTGSSTGAPPPPSLHPHIGACWIEGAAGILGGRPREAAPAGETGPRPVWAFRRSSETISCLWPTWMVKLLAPLETTRYGPAYGAASGLCWPPTARTRDSPGLSEPAACWPRGWWRHVHTWMIWHVQELSWKHEW